MVENGVYDGRHLYFRNGLVPMEAEYQENAICGTDEGKVSIL